MIARHPIDVAAIATYVAGGGLAAIVAFAGQFFPGHEQLFSALSVAIVAVAGLIRVIWNPTPPPGTVAAIVPAPPVVPKVLPL